MENFYEILTILNKFIFILFLYTVDSLLFKSEIFLWKITETYAFLIYLYTEIPIHFLSESSIDIFLIRRIWHYLFLKILQNNHKIMHMKFSWNWRITAQEIWLLNYSNFLSPNSIHHSPLKNTNSTTRSNYNFIVSKINKIHHMSQIKKNT